MPNTTIAFVDTETTSLRPDRRAWEVALIVRRSGEDDEEHAWMVDYQDIDLPNADLYSLRVGRFHERHPSAVPVEQHHWLDPSGTSSPEYLVAAEVEQLTRGAHLVGAVPNFDAEVLAAMLRRHGLLPAWHYHLVDVETLAVGWLSARSALGRALGDPPLTLPWNSEDLSRRCGVEPPGEDVRHTALGDARWARDLHDAVIRYYVLAEAPA